MMDKPTYVEIDLGAITRNVEKIVKTYADYAYPTAIVKADCYGHRGNRVVRAIRDGGAKLFAVSFFNEAMEIRREFPDLPLMLLIAPPLELLDACVENNIAVTVSDLDYVKQIADKPVRVHIRCNGGWCMYDGPRDRESFGAFTDAIARGRAILEGVYLHNYFVEDEAVSFAEFAAFEAMTEGFDLSKIPIVSTHNSLALVKYPKKPYSNAFRMGNIMYGIENTSLGLEDTYRLSAVVTGVKDLKKGESVGYGKCFVAEDGPARVAMIQIGYGDGFMKTNIGRDVFIRDKRCKLVGVTMDLSLVEVDGDVSVGDVCVLIRDNRHIDEIAEHIHTIAEEELCALNMRVARIYRD